MKSWKIVIPALLACSLFASMALAQGQTTITPVTPMKGSFVIGPMGGLTVPLADLSDKNKGNFGMGWDFGGLAEYYMTDQVGIGVDGAYGTMSNKDNSDIKAKTTSFGAHLTWLIPTGGKMMPYLGAGVGYYNRKIEAGSVEGFKKGGIGANGGVGVGFMLTPNVGLGVDGRYHWTQTIKAEDIGPGAEDVNWSFISFNAALLYRFSPGAAMGGMK